MEPRRGVKCVHLGTMQKEKPMLKRLSLALVLAYASTSAPALTVVAFDRTLVSDPGFEKVQRTCPKGTRWHLTNKRCEKD